MMHPWICATILVVVIGIIDVSYTSAYVLVTRNKQRSVHPNQSYDKLYRTTSVTPTSTTSTSTSSTALNGLYQPKNVPLQRTMRSTTRLYLWNFLNEGKKALVRKIAGDYDSIAIRTKINDLISSNSVVMLSFTTCPFCIKAKAALDSKKATYEVIELDVDPDGKAIRAELGDMIGRTSVPAIWINGQFIGGCNDGPMGGIVSLNEKGLLDDMLKKAKAIPV